VVSKIFNSNKYILIHPVLKIQSYPFTKRHSVIDMHCYCFCNWHAQVEKSIAYTPECTWQ